MKDEFTLRDRIILRDYVESSYQRKQRQARGECLNNYDEKLLELHHALAIRLSVAHRTHPRRLPQSVKLSLAVGNVHASNGQTATRTAPVRCISRNAVSACASGKIAETSSSKGKRRPCVARKSIAVARSTGA